MKNLKREVIEGLRKSKAIVGPLHKVVLDRYGKRVTGNYRKAADPDWPEEIHPEIKTEKDRVLVRIHENYRKPMPDAEVKKDLLSLAEILVGEGVPSADICPQICELVPYSERHVRRLLPDEYKHGEKKRLVFKPKVFNIWNFNKCDDRFGREGYKGRIPGQIIQNILYFFLEDGDSLIVDPMAGSGTTHDVVEWWNETYGGKIRCLSYDVNPSRGFITGCDMFKNGLPKEAVGCDLLFLDPYYYDMVTEQFKTIESFQAFLEKLASVSFEALKPGGKAFLLMCDRTKSDFIYLRGIAYDVFKKKFNRPIAVISVPLPTEQATKEEVLNARDSRRLLGRDRTLFVFRK